MGNMSFDLSRGYTVAYGISRCGKGFRRPPVVALATPGDTTDLEQHLHELLSIKSVLEEDNMALSRKLDAVTNELHQRDDQIELVFKEQNEMLFRLEQAYEDIEYLSSQNESLKNEIQSHSNSLQMYEEQLADEKLGRLAAEKTLHSSNAYIEKTLEGIEMAQQERDDALEEIKRQQKVISKLEEDIVLAAHDAREYLQKEMKALADIEMEKDISASLRQENEKLRNKLIQLQTEVSLRGDAEEKPKRKRGRPRKVQAVDDASVVRDDVSDAAEVAQAVASEAKKRSYEIRAEAALLVETVEDRAVELVEKAQREVAVLKAELEKTKSNE
ncbi:hypothetical protein M9435_002167 [Picochlorum sp. BPE23]|nr:hypothetical protein M9435_002167 [Picochlorum sp. BPE23]